MPSGHTRPLPRNRAARLAGWLTLAGIAPLTVAIAIVCASAPAASGMPEPTPSRTPSRTPSATPRPSATPSPSASKPVSAASATQQLLVINPTAPGAGAARMRFTQAANANGIVWWVRDLNARTASWTRYWESAATEDTIPITMIADGRFGLLGLAKSAGTAGPDAAAQPETVVVIDSMSPRVTLTAPAPGHVVRKGDSIAVAWTTDEANPTGTVEIWYEPTGGEARLLAAVPDTGKWTWTNPPRDASQTGRLRIVARDLAGYVGVARSSRPMAIDVDPPAVQLLGASADPATGRIVLNYAAEDVGGAGLAKVELLYRPAGSAANAKWTAHPEPDNDVFSPISSVLPEGAYEIGLRVTDRAGNTVEPSRDAATTISVSLALAVDTTAPKIAASIVDAPKRVFGGALVKIKWKATDAGFASGATPVSVGATGDRGDGAKQAIAWWSGLPAEGELTWTADPDDWASVEFHVTATDAAGLSTTVAAGSVAVDAFRPAAVVNGIAQRRGKLELTPLVLNRGNLTPDPVTPYDVWFCYSNDDGTWDWKQLKVSGTTPSGAVQVEAAVADAGFSLVFRSKEGVNEAAPTKTTPPEFHFDQGHAPEPSILTAPAARTRVKPRGTVDVQWTVGPRLPERTKCDLEMSTDGGATWTPVAADLPNNGNYKWTTPVTPARQAILRLTTKSDIVRTNGHSYAPAVVTIDGDAPATRLSGPREVRGDAVAFTGGAVDASGSAVSKLRLYARTAGEGAWGMTAEFAAPELAGAAAPLSIPAQEGRREYWLGATDQHGNEAKPGPDSLPMVTVLADRTPPTVTLLSFLGSNRYVPGRVYPVRWQAADSNLGPAPVTVELGIGGAWRPLAAGIANSGTLRVELPADMRGTDCQIRVTVVDAAGNATSAQTRGTFQITEFPAPRAMINGPREAASGRFELTYDLFEYEQTGISNVELWVTEDAGRRWYRWANDDTRDGKMPFFARANGRWGFTMIASDLSGLSDPLPSSGDAPQWSVPVRYLPEALDVRVTPDADYYQAGADITIAWTAQPDLFDRDAVSVQSSTDLGRTWTAAPVTVTNAGTWTLTLPDKAATLAISVRAVDKAGTTYERYRYVTVDSSVPVVTVTLPREFRAAAPSRIGWKAADDRLAANAVTIRFSDDAGNTWKILARDLPASGDWEGVLPTPAREGCQIRVTAVDRAGNVGIGQTAFFTVLNADGTPPAAPGG